MADIWIDVDTALTELPVNKVPLVASSDGFTTDETISYNEAGMDLNWNFITSTGSFTQTNVVPTTAGTHDWTHQGNAMYTIEVPASAGTINNDTEGYGWFSGVATGIVPFTSPIYGFRAAAINDALCDGGDLLDVNTTQISGTAQTANDVGADVNDILTDTGTTIPGTITTLQADTDDIQTRLPAALVGGAMDCDVSAIQANVITATAIASDAITAAKIATDAIGSDELAATAITEIWAQVVESVGSRTAQQALSIILAAVAGVTADAGATIKDAAGTNTRIAATINGSNERTAMTLTPSS